MTLAGRKRIGLTAGWGATKVWPTRATIPQAVVTHQKAGSFFSSSSSSFVPLKSIRSHSFITVHDKQIFVFVSFLLPLSTIKAESPRPIGRKKNKPAPVPPGMVGGWAQPKLPSASPSPLLARTPENEERKQMPVEGWGQHKVVGSSPLLIKTPEKDDKKLPLIEGTPSDVKPSLPPTGPDSKRLSALPGEKKPPLITDKKPALPTERKPTLAPRPSSTAPHYAASQSVVGLPAPGIGFEPIEQELRRQGSLRVSAPAGSAHKSDDEGLETRKPPPAATHKRLSSYENILTNAASANPTHHPNAVSIFGAYNPAAQQQDRGKDKVDGEKPKPNVPERPTVIKVQGNINTSFISHVFQHIFISFCVSCFTAQTSGSGATPEKSAQADSQSPTESKGHAVLERVHSFSVNKQQVSIVHVNSNSPSPAPPLTLGSNDHSDIQYADSEDALQSTPSSSVATGSFLFLF